MARAHRGARGERLDAEVVPGVGGDPALEVAQTVALRRLRGELDAELRLVPRASQEEHQPAGDGERGLVAEVVLDEREREVDARGDSGGGEDVAVTNEDRVGFDPNSRMTARECLARGPVSGRAPAVEEPGGGEHEGAGADRRDPGAASRRWLRAWAVAFRDRRRGRPGGRSRNAPARLRGPRSRPGSRGRRSRLRAATGSRPRTPRAARTRRGSALRGSRRSPRGGAAWSRSWQPALMSAMTDIPRFLPPAPGGTLGG